MTSRTRRLVATAASTVLLGLAAVACSAGDEGGTDSSVAAPGGSAEAPAAAEAAYDADDSAAADAADADGAAVVDVGQASGGSRSEQVVVDSAGDPRSLIKEGNVALRSGDVARTIFDIRKVLAQTGGEVSDDDTQADDEGDAELALLTVRVPVGRYESALEKLKALGTGQDGVDLVSSTSTTQDVSTEVVDTDVRVALQRRSLQRISLLLDRATSIRDVVAIERELASREADLGSLEGRQKLLADQTTRSTITVSVERPGVQEAAEAEEDETGFVAGLQNGWEAFQDVTTGLLTGAGALLPFALLALLLGVPARAWLRRRQPRPVVGVPDATA